MLSGAEGPVDTSNAPTYPDVTGKVGVVAAFAGGRRARPGSVAQTTKEWYDANQRGARRPLFACWLTRKIYRQDESERWLMTFGDQPSVRLRSSAIPVNHKEEIHVEQTRHPDERRWRQLHALALVSRPWSTERSPCGC
jgi:hypothetical protein